MNLYLIQFKDTIPYAKGGALVVSNGPVRAMVHLVEHLKDPDNGCSVEDPAAHEFEVVMELPTTETRVGVMWESLIKGGF